MKISSSPFFAIAVAGGLLIGAAIACAPFRNSPYSDQLLSSGRDLNLKAMNRVQDVETDGIVRIAVLADPHQNYNDLDQVIYDINQTSGIDFIVNLGDITNDGYNLEYDQYIDSVTSFRRPAFTVIGNHDAIGAGPSLFKRAFSDSNFYFESSTLRYIFFNTANLEDPDEFDPQWLKDTVNASSKPVIIFTHCSLQDPERFHDSTAQIFDDVLNDSRVRLVLNGHNHVYALDNYNGTVLLQSARVQGLNWLLLEIQGTQLTIHNEGDGTSTVVTLKN